MDMPEDAVRIQSNLLKALFQNVYFINGTAYAGKSTMVRMLAEKYDGILCGENYHDVLSDIIDEQRQPNLFYLKHVTDWQAFVSRTPEEYEAWIRGSSHEAAELELLLLIQYAGRERQRKIFVDTNIRPEILRTISDYHHVLFMLAPQETSVNRFFEREDEEKQFLYQVLSQCKDRKKAFSNYRECLRRINSKECYDSFAHSGFFCLCRDDRRSALETLALAEEHFQLQ